MFDLVGAELNQTQSTDWVQLSSIDYVAHLLISCITNLDPKSLDKMERNQCYFISASLKDELYNCEAQLHKNFSFSKLKAYLQDLTLLDFVPNREENSCFVAVP